MVVRLQLLDIEDGFLSLMDDTGNTRDDLKVPEGEIGEEIQREYGDGKDLLVRSSQFEFIFLSPFHL